MERSVLFYFFKEIKLNNLIKYPSQCNLSIMIITKIKICPKAQVFLFLAFFLSSAFSQDIPFLPLTIKQPLRIPKDYSIVNTIIYPTPDALKNSNNQKDIKQPLPEIPDSTSFQQNPTQKKENDQSKQSEDGNKIPWKSTQPQLIRDYIIDQDGKEVALTPTQQSKRQKGRPLQRQPRQKAKNLHSTFTEFPTLQDNPNNKRPLPPFAKQRHSKKLNFQQIGNYLIIILMAIGAFITFIFLCTRTPQQQSQHLQRKHLTGRQRIPQSEQWQQPQQQEDQYLSSSIIIIKNRQTSLN